jgi:dienelactone hydrolase
MMRAALLWSVVMIAAARPAAATDYYHEDLHIAIPAAGPRGLEALLVRPAGPQRYPLALISHGTSPDAQERHDLSPQRFYPQAVEFARRGFAALVVMRRGYGDSSGSYAEGTSCCNADTRLRAAKSAASDLKAAVIAVRSRPDISPEGMIAVGVSSGGFATVALTADPPAGLSAAISFAGGLRGDKSRTSEAQLASDQAGLVEAFRTLGRRSRIPMLWIYAANDSYFDPGLAHRLLDAFTAAGGRAQLIDAAAFGTDGHELFLKGGAVWHAMVDDFLHQQKLGLPELLPAPPLPDVLPPPQFGGKGRAAFFEYLAAGLHKAFAVSSKGSYGYWAGLRSSEEAKTRALARCAELASDCALYAVENELAAGAGKSP